MSSNVNFTVYRNGEAAFKLESRRQGHVRKVTQASFKEEIMTNDAISISLLSTEKIDFKLRDLIVYKGRPYVLNTIPECSIDSSKLYTYNMTFEGAFYEMGRVAFVLSDAYGYDFYGTLPEFARLVVDNMNRVNMWIAWTYNGVEHKARNTYVQYYQGEKYYGWRDGLGSVTGVNYVFTRGIPSVGDTCYVVPNVPSTAVVTEIHKWSLDFPEGESDASYPSPSSHIPENIEVYGWDEGAQDDYLQYIHDSIPNYNASNDSGTEWLNWDEGNEVYTEKRVYDNFPQTLVWRTPLDQLDTLAPSLPPQSPTDTYEAQNALTFKIRCKRYMYDVATQAYQEYSERIDSVTVNIPVRFHAELSSSSSWQIEPISGGTPSGHDALTESKLLSYDSNSCLSVLQDLASQWEDWEWRISDSVDYGYVNGETLVCGTIIMRKREAIVDLSSNVHSLSFGKKGGLSSVKRRYADGSNIPSRVYFYGGGQNLPQYYRNTRLCLPSHGKEDSYIDFGEMVDENGNYIFPLGLSNKTCEEVVLFDGIYPANEPFTIKSNWGSPSIVTDTLPSGTSRSYLMLTIPKTDFFLVTDKWKDNSSSDYSEWLTLMQVNDDNAQRQRYMEHFVGKSKYMLGGETPMFVFQTGAIAGYSLSVHKCYMSNDNYVYLLNVVKESNEEIDNYYVPNANLGPVVGDKFIVDNINMPVSYTYYQEGGDGDYSAENALWVAALKYMTDTAAKVDYEIEVSSHYLVNHPSTDFRIFDGILLNDPLTDTTQKLRVTSVERDLVDGYKCSITVTNRRMIRPLHNLGVVIGHQQNGA